MKEWFRESMWVYPKDDKEVMDSLEKALKENRFPNCEVWQNQRHLKGDYPQYLCSGDLGGYAGDVVHFWRDGQTWWPVSGDYTLDDENEAELILRQVLKTKGGE